ncbi:polynucleotide adenylyltransferase PcnB [Comamonas piscis]|uniref:Poly(A) polymerase I n=1 Tax=Comamonas piscis TaxID=1562974 RepID=A0A7G5EG16_9BURK|nr:polynucleotide adenylyltransferase PcnB [Comamonas piscis]QMV72941.1 polynucleotide adenylyltransferase PcnB [Comamonas piscis]WSO35722.1 polynucleotide adenylyltransferase PcnB [Comamonas piscis]
MIKNIIDKLLGKATAASKPKNPFGKREEVGVDVHKIDPAMVDRRAVDVCSTLKEAGFEAYIVGGAVRDLLLGLRPKDFDVATNATPEQVKSLFRRAFIIGRRFRIVHVVYGRGRENEVIEVTTFRAFLDSSKAEQVQGNEKTSRAALAGMKLAVDESGRVLRDNVWGPQNEDAARRDFTVNAMYYDPQTQIVVDYHKGIRDAQKLVLRMIGDPTTRYREDPVRIIRAVRFAAKLSKKGFTIDPKTAKPLVECAQLLQEVPQSRMFDEMLKLLQTGHSLASIEQLRHLGLAKGIYPLLDVVVDRANLPFVQAALMDTDRRVAEGKSVAPSFLLACVLWQDVKTGWDSRMARGEHPHPALQDAIDDVFNHRIGDVSGRGKLAADMREIWVMQPRFEKRTGSTPFGMIAQARFRAGFDFLRLRADVAEVDEALANWWQEFQQADEARREDLIAQVREEQRAKPKTGAAKPKRAPRKPAAASGGAGSAGGEQEAGSSSSLDQVAQQAFESDDADAVDAPVKKRRRRRRKPGNAEGGTSAAADTE